MKLKLLATAAFFAFSSAAMAADAVDAKIQELFSQGYTHFQVARGANTSQIEAYGANLPKLELRLSSLTGDVLSQSVEPSDATDHSNEIARISETARSHDQKENRHRERETEGEIDDDLEGSDGDHRGRAGASVSGSSTSFDNGWDDNGWDDNHNGAENDDVGGIDHDGGFDENNDVGGMDHDGGMDSNDHDGGSDHDSGHDDD